MKIFLASVSAIALIATSASAMVPSGIPSEDEATQATVQHTAPMLLAAKGRGKNGDKAEDNPDDDDDASGSGRDKPRIPGGSGCDDPGDIQEHAECAG